MLDSRLTPQPSGPYLRPILTAHPVPDEPQAPPEKPTEGLAR